MFVALIRACVLSGFGVSLRTSSYAMPYHLSRQLRYYKHLKEKTTALQA